jgi:outer membrane protein assembly factor BamD
MTLTRFSRGLLIAFCISCALLAGCRESRERKAQQNNPVAIYRLAHQRMLGGDFKSAVKMLESLTARFPFTPQARQAHLDLIYCYYRDGESESATDAADTFIRENPINPRVDYAYYMKGLIDFERTPNVIERWLHADLTKRPPSTARKSFESFRRLVQQYPKSEYAHDALQRMVYLRNRLAEYDVHVAEYYMKRGAFVGAAQRATDAMQQYDGAPAVRDALKILIAADERLGLNPRADQVREVYAANFPQAATPNRLVAEKDKHWWQFWK